MFHFWVKTSFHPEKPSGTTSKHNPRLKTLQQLGDGLWKKSQMWKTSEAEAVENESFMVLLPHYSLKGTESGRKNPTFF